MPFVQVDPKSASATDRAIAAAQTKLRRDDEDADAQLGAGAGLPPEGPRDRRPDALHEGRHAPRPGGRGGAGRPAGARRAGHACSWPGTASPRASRSAAGRSRWRRATRPRTGVVVDASNELGRYDEAAEATQHMVDVRPNLASLSRVSYARELHGDLDGAIAAMSQAVTAAAGVVAARTSPTCRCCWATCSSPGATSTRRSRPTTRPSRPSPTSRRPPRAGPRCSCARASTTGRPSCSSELVEVQPLPEYAIALGDALRRRRGPSGRRPRPTSSSG